MTCIMMKMLGNVFGNVLSVDALHQFSPPKRENKAAKGILILVLPRLGVKRVEKLLALVLDLARLQLLHSHPILADLVLQGKHLLLQGMHVHVVRSSIRTLRRLRALRAFLCRRMDVSAVVGGQGSKVSGSQVKRGRVDEWS